ERAKALLKEARAVGAEVSLLCNSNANISREVAQVVQDQWTAIGFKVAVNLLDTVPWNKARDDGTFAASIQGHTYRYDPDDFFGRDVQSTREYSHLLPGSQ